MIPDGEFSRKEEHTGLSTSRADFVSTLPRRLDVIAQAIASLEQQPDHSGRRDNLLRRLHALSASAKVLGFAAAADVLSRAEQRLRTSQLETLDEDLGLVRKLLADLPAMVQRGTYSIAPPLSTSTAPSPSSVPASRALSGPFSVLLFGSDETRNALLAAQGGTEDLEITCSTSAEDLRRLAAALGPDALLLDTTQGSITLLVDELAHAPETSGLPILALNVPEDATQALVDLGVRVALSPRATEHQILKALSQARKPVEPRSPSLPPFGEVSLVELADRITREVHQGLVESASADARSTRVSLGDGTVVRAAIWSALAQIREHVVEQSEGRVRFELGPDGSFPLAPGLNHLTRGPSIPGDPVDLTGRRILVADDDPAVAWLVGGTLRAAGAVVTEAHDGARALELAYRVWPELVVSDILMPGLDGFALCHALKRDVLLRDVPVVLLSWKEDLLFRLRDLGSDADGYLRKEAAASTVVRRVQELLQPRRALERRLGKNLGASAPTEGEVRGRLDSMTVRQLLEIATALERPVRVTLRDATSLFELRIREGSLKAATRTRHDGTTERGNSVLQALISVTAGRFSVTSDHDPLDAEFEESLPELLRPFALRARAAQRVLSGLSLGLVDRLVLAPDAFTGQLSLLPLSFRHLAEELSRGIAPRQLLASGAASVHLLESLLADVARRGAVRAISSADGTDLLEQEMLALTAQPQVVPPKPAPAPTPLFTFQLSPSPPESRERIGASGSTPPRGKSSVDWDRPSDAPPPNPDTWGLPSGTLSGVGVNSPSIPSPTAKLSMTPSLPVSKPPPMDDVDWAMELSWDDTPPPQAPQASHPPQVAAAPDEFPSSRPITSGGFMRPSLPTPERRSHTDTPDLANAVVKAVSQGTPAPEQAAEPPYEGVSKAVPVDNGDQTSANPAADLATADLATASPANANLASAANALTVLAETKGPREQPEEHDAGVRTDVRDNSSASDTHRTTPSPVAAPYAQKPRATTRFPNPTPGASAPAAAAATAAITAAIPITAVAAAPHAVKNSSTGARLTLPQGSLLEPGAREPTPTAATNAPVPDRTAPQEREDEPRNLTPVLPTVQKPPRPAEQASPNTHHDYESDPVFPLISAAPAAVEIQQAIEIGEPASPPRDTSEKTPTDAAAPNVMIRDTLRSPADSTPVPTPDPARPDAHANASAPSSPDEASAARRFDAPDAPDEASAARRFDAPDAPDEASAARRFDAPDAPDAAPHAIIPLPLSLPEPLRSSDASAPAASPIPAEPTRAGDRNSTPNARTASGSPAQAHSVSWVQAVGLAFLAGAITFAVTVPVARWWRDRPSKPPAVASESAPNMAPPLLTARADLESQSQSPQAGIPSGNSTLPEAVIDAIPTPGDVTLAPGQALIEVVTAGGHAIFVDDTFVGRGPVRVVTVTPGKHQVRTRLNGIERRDWIEVGAGRSMRLSLAPTWK
jgi:CheY-like chemotaxis protein/HPt (histidine-containing phosphotransfer) domain-containing protein